MATPVSSMGANPIASTEATNAVQTEQELFFIGKNRIDHNGHASFFLLQLIFQW